MTLGYTTRLHRVSAPARFFKTCARIHICKQWNLELANRNINHHDNWIRFFYDLSCIVYKKGFDISAEGQLLELQICRE